MGYTMEEARAAAKKLPKNRTVAEQATVDQAKSDYVEIRNLNEEAKKVQRFGS